MTDTLIIRAERALLPCGESPATILCAGGRITGVIPAGRRAGAPAPEPDVTLGADRVLLPGVVDTHVHVNDPGRAEWEGFPTATRAAAAGGVTTIVDMPLNSTPSTVTTAALDAKLAAADGTLTVDCGFWGGIVPANIGTGDLRALHDAGVLGFKCFLIHSGVDDFPDISYGQLEVAMAEIAEFDGLVLAHCEDPALVAEATRRAGGEGGDPAAYATFLRTRPPESERRAVEAFIAAAEATGCRGHIVHVTEAGCVDLIRDARARGVRVTAETCPHYLALHAEAIADGATHQKCCPPIRDAANREALWEGLADGTLTCVVTDHSPCPPELKLFHGTGHGIRGFGAAGAGGVGLGAPFAEAWGGIASLELSLTLTWTHARMRGFGLGDVLGWLAAGPADVAGLPGRGRIEVGARADLVDFAPDETFLVRPADLHHRNPVTAYADHALAGVVHRTWVGGQLAWDRATGEFPAEGAGHPINRKDRA